MQNLIARSWLCIEKYVIPWNSEQCTSVNSTNITQPVPAGYYLIKDADTSHDDQHDAYTDFIVQVAGNVEIIPAQGRIILRLRKAGSGKQQNDRYDW